MSKGNSEPLWASKGYFSTGTIKPGDFYVLLEDRISVSSGIFGKTSNTLLLHRISAVETKVNIIGRIFKCGDVIIHSRQKEAPTVVISVKDPAKIANLIHSAIAQDRVKFQKKQQKKQVNNYRRQLK